MAPEQVEGREADARSALFAFGAVLFEMLTGRRAFEGTSQASVIAAILDRDPPAVSALLPLAPPALDRLVQRCLAKNPDDRWGSVHDVACEMRGIAETLSEAQRDARTDAAPPTKRSLSTTARLTGLARRRWWLTAPAVVGVALLGWFLLGQWTRPALAFKERDFVVVADVVNATGEPVFDLAIKSALETDLRQSRYVNVVDPSQVRNALVYSRLSANAPLDSENGRTVCRRVGAKALLVPQILKAGEAYQLQVTLVEPTSGRTADDVRVTARGREEVLLSSIDRLTRELRGRLGETMASIARTDPPFAQYTTSSLEALQMLTLGAKARDASDLPRAERYFRAAIQLDPRFAAARASLGLILIQFLGGAEEGKKLLAEALQEEGKVSEREYLHLRALNKQFVTQDLQGALEDYRFLSDRYPDLMPPYNNSGRILEQLGRPQEAAAMYERAHTADPRAATPLWNLWTLAIGGLKDPVRAERVARSIVDLQPDNAFARHAVAWSLVAQRRFSEAEEGMRATLKLNPSHEAALPNLGHLLYRRGAPSEAVAIYREVTKRAKEGSLKTGVEHADLSLGLALAAAGDTAEGHRTLVEAADRIRARGGKKPLPPEDEAMVATMLAGAGRQAEARTLAERADRGAKGSIDVNYELARTWAVLGDHQRAIRYLEAACAAGYDDLYVILIDPPLLSLQKDPAMDRLAPRMADTR
jgi:tetratricopeptide (TPR) repeat protein